MSYNATYSKIYRALLQISGEFDMKSVMITAYLSSPEHFTKAQIKEIALLKKKKKIEKLYLY